MPCIIIYLFGIQKTTRRQLGNPYPYSCMATAEKETAYRAAKHEMEIQKAVLNNVIARENQGMLSVMWMSPRTRDWAERVRQKEEDVTRMREHLQRATGRDILREEEGHALLLGPMTQMRHHLGWPTPH